MGGAIALLVAPKFGAKLRTDRRDAAERGAEAFRKVGSPPEPEGGTKS
jgi:hypothetical protein